MDCAEYYHVLRGGVHFYFQTGFCWQRTSHTIMYHLLAIVRYRHGKFYFNASKIKHCYLQVLTIVLLTCIQARNPMQTQLCCGIADKLTANFTRGFRKDLRKKLKIFLVLYMHMNILKKSSTVGIINKLEIKNFLIEFTIIRNRKSFQVTDYSR